MRRLLVLLPLGLSLFLKPTPQQTGGSLSMQGAGLAIQIPSSCGLAEQNVAFACSLSAVNGAGGYTWSKVSGSFPTGISDVTSGGVVAGTPTGTTTGTEVVMVTDAAGTSVTMTIPITPASLTGTGPCGSALCVTPTNQSVLTAATLPLHAKGYWSNNVILDMDSLVAWTCPAGGNPGCGTVSVSGLFTASGSSGSADPTATFNSVSGSTTVTVGSGTPTLQNTTLCNGQINQAYPESPALSCPLSLGAGGGQQLQATGGTGPYTFSLNSGSLPAGLSFASSGNGNTNDVIAGTPTVAGTTAINLKVCDSASHCVTPAAINLIVASVSSIADSVAQASIPTNSADQASATCFYSDSSSAACPSGLAVTWKYVGGSVGPAISSTTTVTVSNVPSGQITVCGAVNVNGAGTAQTLTSVQDGAAHSFTILGPTTYTNFIGQNWLAYFIGSITSPVTFTWGAGSQQYDAGCDSFNVSAGTITADGTVQSVSGAAASTNVSSPSFTPTGTDLLYANINPQQNLSQFNSPWSDAANMKTVAGAGNGYVLGATAATSVNATESSPGKWSGLVEGFNTSVTNTGLVWSLVTCPTGVQINATTGAITSGSQAGTCTVKGTIGAISGTTSLTIAPPNDTAIIISSPACSSSPCSVTINGTLQFTATGNNSHSILSGVSWGLNPNSCGSLGGTAQLNPTTFQAGAVGCTTTISATAAGLSGASANISVTAPSSGALLTGCTVNSSNVPSCSVPAGWSLVTAQGYDAGSLASGQSFQAGSPNTTTINCTVGHTGNCSMDSFIQASFHGYGMKISGSTINHRELEIHFFMMTNNSNPGFGHTYTNWSRFIRSPQGSGIAFGIDEDYVPPASWLLGGTPEWVYFGNINTPPPQPWSKYGSFQPEIIAQWYEVEGHVKTNDPGQTNGELELFINGQLALQCLASTCPTNGGSGAGNLNGSVDYSTADLFIGGDWGANIWYNDLAHTICSTTGDTGTTGANVNGVTANMAACQCANQCPPNGNIPSFHIYMDDLVVIGRD